MDFMHALLRLTWRLFVIDYELLIALNWTGSLFSLYVAKPRWKLHYDLLDLCPVLFLSQHSSRNLDRQTLETLKLLQYKEMVFAHPKSWFSTLCDFLCYCLGVNYWEQIETRATENLITGRVCCRHWLFWLIDHMVDYGMYDDQFCC